MKTSTRRGLTLLLTAALLLALSMGPASAAETTYEPVRVYVDGLLMGRGYRSEGTVFLSPEDICRYMGIDTHVDFDEKTCALQLSAPGLELEREGGTVYLEVNDRYLYLPEGILEVGGRAYLPLEVAARVFNLAFESYDEQARVDLDMGQAGFIVGGPTYYSDTFGSDNLLWLSRIISAESRDQSLPGRIGVGNVVLNRVKSDRFPNTVFDVVFDTRNGIQFEPVMNGTIYDPASREGIIAACLCLEGYNTVGDSLFFVASSLADDSWFKNYRVYVTRIGNHDFYA